jgi:hypothetical protein
MKCKGKGKAKLCVGKPQKYALRILVEAYHIILFASPCVVRHIRVVLSYVVIPVVPLLLCLYNETCHIAPYKGTALQKRHMIVNEVRRIQLRNVST